MKDRLRKLVASLTSVCVLIAPTISYAGINSLLNNIVDGSYSQSPGLIKSPTTNTLSFGSYSFRMNDNLMNAPLLSFTPPHATLSCAGADFNAGWLSVMGFPSFQSLLTNAGTELAWGIVLGMVYSLPGVADTFQKLNEWSRKFQDLSMDACTTGLELGKHIGSSIWARAKNRAEGNATKKGDIDTYERAETRYPKEIVKYGQYKKFFGDIPYGPLHEEAKELKDKHPNRAQELENSQIDDLIASLFGIIDWKAVKGEKNPKKGESLKICTKLDCLRGSNIKVTYLPPIISDLDILMNGGKLELYHCNWGKKQVTVSGSVSGQSYSKTVTIHICTNNLKKKTLQLTKGLRGLVDHKIKKIVDNIVSGKLNINGTSNPNSEELQWIKSIPVPGFLGMLNYLAVLKERGFEAEYRNARYGISELIAALMLKSMIDNAEEALTSAWTYLAEKNATDDLHKEEENIAKAGILLNEYVNDNIKQNFTLIQTAEKTYQSLRRDAEHSFYKRFGKSAQLFIKP